MINAEGISLVPDMPVVVRGDVKLVKRTLADGGNEPFPDTRAAFRLQTVRVAVPVVEIPNHRNFLRVRRPDAEYGSRVSVESCRMGPEVVVGAVISAFVEQIEVVRRKQRNVVTYGIGDTAFSLHLISLGTATPASVPAPVWMHLHARLHTNSF